MKYKFTFLITAVVVLIMLTGCSQGNRFEPDTFSKDDLAIIKEDDSKFKLSYGMSRDDVEKLLGAPKEDENSFKHQSSYDFGVRIMYRDDTVAGIVLEESSKGIYQTVRGIGVGMTREQIEAVYGSKYALKDQSYMYDSKSERFIESPPNAADEKPEDLEQIYAMTPTINGDNVSRIHLLDFRMAARMD